MVDEKIKVIAIGKYPKDYFKEKHKDKGKQNNNCIE
jgi:hypothetical protein